MATISKLIYLSGGVTKVLSLSADDINVGGLQIGGVSLSGTSGSTLVGSATLTNYSGSTVSAQLSSIDTTAINKAGSVTFTANQPMGGFKLTGLAAGSGAGDSVRYEQVILRDGSQAFTAAQSMGGFKLTSVADPTTAQDAATKAYVDAVAQGLKPKAAVRAASTVNATLATAFANGQTLDSYTLVTGDRILIKDQTLSENNGIYIVQASGAPVRATDMDSLSPIDEVNGAYTFIQSGGQAGQGWVETSVVVTIGTDPMTWVYFNAAASVIGGDMITVTGSTISVDLATVSGLESSNPGNAAGQLRVKLEASNPSLKITGSNELAAKLDAAGAITSGASGLIVGTDGTSIEISSNALRIASGAAGSGLGYSAGVLSINLASPSGLQIVTDNLSIKQDVTTANTIGITSTVNGAGILFDSASFADSGSETLALAAGVAGNGLALTSGILSVNVDSSTIEINADTLLVKDAGITLAKLASNSVDENKIVSTSFDAAGAITGGSGTKIAAQVDNSTIEISSNALRIKDAGVTAAKLNSNVADQTTITGGAGSALAVQYAPITKATYVAGEAFAANTSFLVRWALTGETAGRVYKADQDNTTTDNFYAFGLALSTSAVSAGGSINVIQLGSQALGSSDSAFSAGDIGKPLFLTTSGAFSKTAPSAALSAIVRVGMIQDTTHIFIGNIQLIAINP